MARPRGAALRRGAALLGAAALICAPVVAWADSPTEGAARGLTFRADHLETDGALREFTLRGGVSLRYGRYRVESESIRIVKTNDGIDIDGEASLALCPCLDPPISFAFSSATASPDGDIQLWFPRARLFGAPVFALPWLWIRAPNQVGLLPPSFEWRGVDGLRIGTGVHLPWQGPSGASEPRVLDATVAGYIKGGVALGARLVTPSSTAKVAWDWVGGGRLELLALGRAESDGIAVAWDADAITGERALAGTPDLRAAALPFNSARIEASTRLGAIGSELSARIAAGVIARARRGELSALSPTLAGVSERSAPAAGPVASVAMGGALTGRGAWDALVYGGMLADIDGPGALAVAGASAGASMTAHPGPLEVTLSTRGLGRVADRGAYGSSSSAAASARIFIGAPLARDFGGRVGEAPLVHIVTPSAEAKAAAVSSRGALFAPQPLSLPAARWALSAGASTSLGRYIGPSFRADARVGALGAGEGITHTAARARAALQGAFFSGEILAAAAREGASVADFISGLSGFVLLGRARLGPVDSVSIRMNVAAERGEQAAVARDVADPDEGALLAARPIDYLTGEGWSGGAELSIPWSRAVRTAARADGDLTAPRLIGANGSLEIAHPCGCFALVASAGYRLGRGAPDVALSVDFAPPPPARR